MRVTLVSPYDPEPPASAREEGHVGGVEKALSSLSQGLADRGHDVTLLCSTKTKAPNQERNGVRILRKRRQGTLFRDPIVHLAPSIPEGTDIVHVAATYPFTTPTTLAYAAKQNIPAVLDFHFEPSPNNALERVGAFAYRLVGPRAYDTAHTVLVRSKDYARNARTLGSIPEHRWKVLPNGIDPDRFHATNGATDGEYILFVGRLVPYKGLSTLLEALDHDPPDLPVKIAGEGPLRDTLEKQAGSIQADVRFLGYVEDEDLPSLYRGARLTVLPSINRHEAFGITLLESMACGTPVLASQLPGVQDVARVGGVLATPGDAEDLAHQLNHAMEHEDLPRGSTLAARVHERYAWSSVSQSLEEVYESVLQEPPARRS